MLFLSILVAALQAAQARLAAAHRGFASRCLVMALCYAQPLIRSWWRYRTRLFSYRPPTMDPVVHKTSGRRLPLRGRLTAAFWSEEGCERTELLKGVLAYLNEQRWGKVIDTGWEDWDLRIYCHPWTFVEACTGQEDHGGGKHLIRVRYRLRPTGYIKLLTLLGGAAAVIAMASYNWPNALVAVILWTVCLGIWWRGTIKASLALAVFDSQARALGLIPCEPITDERRQSLVAQDGAGEA